MKISLGQVVITQGAQDALDREGRLAREFLARHESGDWGDVEDDDAAETDVALGQHLRLFSAYRVTDEVRLWVITEADRSATTLLLPAEY